MAAHERLIGSWAEARPTDLQEWRALFDRQGKEAAASSPDRLPQDVGAGDEQLLPLIVLDNEPLGDAILNLARQAGLQIAFDPRTDAVAQTIALQRRPGSIRFEHVTPREALEVVLDHHGLMMIENRKTRTARLLHALAPPPRWPREIIDLENAPLPPAADEEVNFVRIEQPPVADALRNLARYAGINFQFDPRIPASLTGRPCTLAMSNTTPRKALAREDAGPDPQGCWRRGSCPQCALQVF